ncbi:MAG: hypothetical protein KAV00_12165 [Phycisphaerae bacterium]|nr:hypothetical protein [Phycisphaerae bacterium]
MAFKQFAINMAAGGTATELQLSENGRLRSVMLIQNPLFIRANHVFGQIWLSSTETPNPTKIHLLCQGYFGCLDAIAWDGDIQMEPTFAIQGHIWCDIAVSTRLTANVEI